MTQHPTGSYSLNISFITAASIVISVPARMSPMPFCGFRVKGLSGNFVSATPLQHIRVQSNVLASYGSNYLQAVVDPATLEVVNTRIIATVALTAAGNIVTQQMLDAPLVFFNNPVAIPAFDLSVRNHLGVLLPVAPGNEVTLHLELIQSPTLSHH